MMEVSFELRHSIDMTAFARIEEAPKILPCVVGIFDRYNFCCRRGGKCRCWPSGRAWCLVVEKEDRENVI